MPRSTLLAALLAAGLLAGCGPVVMLPGGELSGTVRELTRLVRSATELRMTDQPAASVPRQVELGNDSDA